MQHADIQSEYRQILAKSRAQLMALLIEAKPVYLGGRVQLLTNQGRRPSFGSRFDDWIEETKRALSDVLTTMLADHGVIPEEVRAYGVKHQLDLKNCDMLALAVCGELSGQTFLAFQKTNPDVTHDKLQRFLRQLSDDAVQAGKHKVDRAADIGEKLMDQLRRGDSGYAR